MDLKRIAHDYVEACSEVFWGEELRRSREVAQGFLWWHNKVYDCCAGADGMSPQPDRAHEISEVPYERRIFYPAPQGRLSLGSSPVAYFAADVEDVVVESRPEFRETPVSQETVDQFMRGQPGVGSEKAGFFLQFKVKPDVPVLDLATNAVGTLSHFGSAASEFLLCILASRDSEAKVATQALSIKASEMGFHGVMYKCVRPPTNVRKWSGCLVMFGEESVYESRLAT